MNFFAVMPQLVYNSVSEVKLFRSCYFWLPYTHRSFVPGERTVCSRESGRGGLFLRAVDCVVPFERVQ